MITQTHTFFSLPVPLYHLSSSAASESKWTRQSSSTLEYSLLFATRSFTEQSASVTASHIPNTRWHRQSPTSRPAAIQWPFMIYEQATITRDLRYDMLKTILCSWGLCKKKKKTLRKTNHLSYSHTKTIMVKTTNPQTKKNKPSFRNAQYIGITFVMYISDFKKHISVLVDTAYILFCGQ